MSPYLTRRLTKLNSEESQVKSKTPATRTLVRTRSATSEAQRVKDDAKTQNAKTRSKDPLSNRRRNIVMVSHAGGSQKENDDRLRKGNNEKKSAQTEKVAVHKKNKPIRNPNKKNVSSKLNKSVSSLRQTSLKESFTKQRKNVKFHTRKKVLEEKLIKECLSPKGQNSIVVLNKLTTNKKKLPVYKSVSPENSPKSAAEVYDFKFDINDSREKLPKKRKRKLVVKKTLNKKKTNTLKKGNVQKTEVHKNESADGEIKKPVVENIKFTQICQKEPINVESKENKEDSPSKSSQNNNVIECPVENQVEKSLQIDQEKSVNIESNETTENNLSEFLPETVKKEMTNIKIKPTIVSVQDFTNKTVKIMNNVQISDSKLLKPANVSNNKSMVEQKNTKNNSLFEQSLSPIGKSSENFNLNSPWRTPQLSTFSQMKKIFQSTPQAKHEITGRKFVWSFKNDSRNYGSITKVKDALNNNENVSMEEHANSLKKKNTTITRKFGTEITNLELSMQSNLMEDSENVPPNGQSIINLSITNASKFDNAENKENSVLSYESPKEILRKEMKNTKALSPRKIAIRSEMQKENFDPQPGPSGLQNIEVFDKERVLRQSNLNNFLNIMETPQSTTIKTPHGIFNDMHSMPVSGKPLMKPEDPKMELKNAFGFDDDSNQDASPVELEVSNDDKENNKVIQRSSPVSIVKPFARISLGELKNNLLPEKRVENIKNIKNVQNKKTEVKKSPIKFKQKRHIDIVNFSDTFDVLSETNESAEENVTNVPLFADLEPSYFTKPPRHSYKRKRVAKFSFSEESDDEEEEIRDFEVKRKKYSKVKKEQERRLMAWVQDINKTFEEVDKHELMVE